ncbi:MAG: acyl-CoA dehydrogenase family protein, partial [Gammaproteobacteria bacterium]
MNELVQALDTVEALVGRSLSATKTACTGERGVSAAALDEYQQVTAELSVCTAEIQCARTYLAHVAAGSDFEQTLAATFCAEMLQNIRNRLARSPADFGLTHQDIDTLPMSACGDLHSTDRLAELGPQVVERGGDLGHRGLDEEKLLMADTFRQFAEEVVKPLAEDIHRQDMIIPDEILEGVRELGCFGLSVPQRYGGLLPDDAEDSLGMIVVTEELSRASLGGAGSLITRPEIMARALMEGGTEEQKQHWLPRIAMGDPLCGIAITEPDYGSDVASMKLKATKTDDGWVLNGAKAWSTFAGKSGVLLTLARTDPDLSLGHRGLSLFMVEKPSFDGEEFEVTQPGGGKLSGQSIPTVGYRGMHSFQLFFDDFFVPASHLLGEGQGLGKGFYFTMRGFSGGRIQTAARACGVMQAAFDVALSYAQD